MKDLSTDMNNKELLIRGEAIVREFWDTYAARGPNMLSELGEMIHPDFIGHGTELNETFFSREDVIKQFIKELDFIPKTFTVSLKSISSSVSGNTVITMADIHVLFHVGKKIYEFNPLRSVITTVVENEKLLILSLSNSVYENSLLDAAPLPGLEEPRNFEEVTVLFADFQKFTNLVGTIPAKKLVSELRDIFARFDEIVNANGLIKIKTIGDAYMAVGGLKPDHVDHAIDCINAAKDMIGFVVERNQNSALKWDLRVGLHSGSVVGGMVGTRKVSFDIFGDTVNIASRIEAASEPGKINISAYTCHLIQGKFECEYRGKIHIKGKGEVDMYWVL